MLKKHFNKMASSGPPYRKGQGLTPAEIDEFQKKSAGGKFRDIPTYSELYGDPRLVEELPDTAAQKVSENLETPFLANLLQVSKKANAAFNPAKNNCIKRIKALSLEFLNKYISTIFEIRRENIRNGLSAIQGFRQLNFAGDSLDNVNKKYMRKYEILRRMCEKGTPRSFERTEGEEEPLLNQYFTAFLLLRGGIGPLGDLTRSEFVFDFERSCRRHVQFLQRMFFGFNTAGPVDREYRGNITNPEVRKWYANLCCAIFFQKFPNGPRDYYRILSRTRNLELHRVVNEFRLMGATMTEMKTVTEESKRVMESNGWPSKYTSDPFMESFIRPYMVPLPNNV